MQFDDIAGGKEREKRWGIWYGYVRATSSFAAKMPALFGVMGKIVGWLVETLRLAVRPPTRPYVGQNPHTRV